MVENVLLFEEGEPSKELRGGKGASLATMTQLGLPIPPGFTITTDVCISFLKNDNQYPDGLWDSVLTNLKSIEEKTGKQFGGVENPLLVSVRSGAAISMPGMMDTVLNVGLNEEIVKVMSEKTNNPRFVKDAYRRLIQMFSDVVCSLDMDRFEDILDRVKDRAGVEHDHQLTEEHLDTIIDMYLHTFKFEYGDDFPTDPLKQLDMAIQAVFKSWNNRRAINYREHEGIPHDLGTAVTVQSMAFGNFGDDSGTGVMFTRNPTTGANEIFGEFLINAQGEDVVAGIRTPIPIPQLKDKMPDIYDELVEYGNKMENHYKDMQDIEFTIEEGTLYILQTRAGKRTGTAAAKIAYDMVEKELLSKEEAVMRLTPRDVEESLFPSVVWQNQSKHIYFDVEDLEHQLQSKTINELTKDASTKKAELLGSGLPAGPGAAAGHVVFNSDLAESIVKGEIEPPFDVKIWRTYKGEKVPSMILIKKETSPADFHGMVASAGILTMRGGLTSHAALVGRQIGKRVIVGASVSGLELRSDSLATESGTVISQGDLITLEIFEDGLVYKGQLPIITPDELPEETQLILDWADEFADIKVRTNADKRNDTQVAVHFKATGTGLARTEHQFFDALQLVREMILANNSEERRRVLTDMLEYQRRDFVDLYEVLDGKPCTIRLLDPPLHEFLPPELELREKIWKEHLHPDSEESRVLRKVLYYQEANPMLGLRGCRLSLLYPEIAEMQTRAILEAALIAKSEGIKVIPEIMIPLIGFENEFRESRKIVDRTAKQVFKERGEEIDYHVGTMIEIPRAALTADKIAGGVDGADFFSFGTNDLHQMTLGFSRDDVGKFLPFYLENQIIPSDPFQTIDEHGVGKLMDLCVELGRNAAAESGKYLHVGICGEQGGDPASIDFCYRIGLDYVSCSPYRVPVARLAAAQATIRNGPVDKKYGKNPSH